MKRLFFNSTVPTEVPYPDKDKILVFMKHGANQAAVPGIPRDMLTGETIPCEMIAYEECGYIWTSADTWHFETYNFELPDDFVIIAKEHYLDHVRERRFK